MNLCLVCRDVRAEIHGGLPRAMADLAQSLAEAGHLVHLLTDGRSVQSPEVRGVTVELPVLRSASGPFERAIPETAPHNLLYAAAVYRAVAQIHEDRQRVDAVLAPLWRSEGAVCLLDDRFPTIVSCMTSLRTLSEIDGSYQLLSDLAERMSLERAALTRSRYLHGLTEAVLTKTIRDYDLSPNATAVIGRGLVDRARLNAGRPSSDPAQRVRVLFVGRIEHRKGVDMLLDAARELAADELPISFTLAGATGDPGLRDSLEREATEHPSLRQAIRFVGAVSDAELDRLYADADIVCVPSRYESHGVVLIEAMMFGKPVVTCDAGGIGEVVEPGRNALVSAPEDAAALARSLRRLANDAQLRAKIGAAGRETYERRFQARSVASRVQSFMEEVIEIHRAAVPETNGVKPRLEQLLCDVLATTPARASQLADELLDPSDPVAERTVQQLRSAAARVPIPRTNGSSPAPRVTAVVLTRDRPRLLSTALDSLEQGNTPLRTIVIDNGSGPRGAARIAADCATRERTELRRVERNLGCAGGRRFGAGLAETEMVLFLDDDAELLPGALEHLLAELNSHPSVDAVTATVVGTDGVVQHSGGSVESDGEVATFGLIGSGLPLATAALPSTGPAGWVPGGAVLIRRALLDEYPIDDRMRAYYEDNEWCYRVAQARGGSFRRSREALVVHHGAPKVNDRLLLVERLTACARFYERHGVLLGPWLFHLVPELRAPDGTLDLAAARILMELVTAKGTEWTLRAWRNEELAGLLSAHRWHVGLDRAEHALGSAQTELTQLKQTIVSQEETIASLRRSHETLCRIEQGGWWRLRSHVLPLIRMAAWLRAHLGAGPGAAVAPTEVVAAPQAPGHDD